MNIIKILLSASIALSFLACGGGESSNESETGIKIQEDTLKDEDIGNELFGFSQIAQNSFELVTDEYEVFNILATGEGLLYELKNAPEWIQINNQGELLVDASGIALGHYPFDLTISDNENNKASKSFEVGVYTTIETLNQMNVYAMNALPFTQIKDPVKSVSSYSVTVVPNSDGVTWDFLKTYFKKYWYNHEIVITDIGSNQTKRIKPEGNEKEFKLSKYNSVIAPNGKLFVTNMMRPNLNVYVSVYNPDTNSFEKEINTSRFVQGEKASISLGTNGKVYVGCSYKDYETDANGNYLDDSRHASAFEIDPETMKVTEYGKLGPNHAPEDRKSVV